MLALNPLVRAAGVALVLFTVLSTSAVARAQVAPDAIVRRYLERGAAGDAAAVRALLMDRCEDTAVGRVEGVRVMGVPMTIRAIRLDVLSNNGAEARVRYTVSGSAQGNNATTRILGATVRIGRVRMANVTQSNVLRLLLRDGRWRIACR